MKKIIEQNGELKIYFTDGKRETYIKIDKIGLQPTKNDIGKVCEGEVWFDGSCLLDGGMTKTFIIKSIKE